MLLWAAIAVLMGIALAEICLRILVARARPQFPWLITATDTCPALDPDAVDRYIERSFDPELGWVRGAGTSGVDITDVGPVTFNISQNGTRADPLGDTPSGKLCVYGDSYAFCRLVADNETWPHYIAEQTGLPVANYGVGNYGVDQAVLRLEREIANFSGDIAIVAVVPETIARIQSYWKHYFEYGNVLAFKPVFRIADGGISLIPQAIRSREDFAQLAQHVARIQKIDPFYRSKFLIDMFRGCYVCCLIRRWRRHLPILGRLVRGWVSGRPEVGKRRAFELVLRENARVVADLYADADACTLFERIVRRADEICRRNGKQFALVIVPQPHDVHDAAHRGSPYADFMYELGKTVPVIDLTRSFAAHPHPEKLYRDGPLGQHCSPDGNRLIASEICRYLQLVAR